MNTPPLSSQLQAKLNRLNKHLESCGALVVGFSGGTDSTLLLHCAHGVLRDRVMAATIDTPYIPRSELAEACTFAAKLGVRHHVLTLPIPNAIRDNPPDRCYRCKKILFDEIAGFAATMGARVADGSNADDQPSQRPGMRALTELNVCSPLREAGLTKEDIRTLSRHAQLPTAHKPANSCLMTRLPTGTLVQESVLSCIEQGEDAIRAMGFPEVRLRTHGCVARIEVPPDRIAELVRVARDSDLTRQLGMLGYCHTTVDLVGLHAPLHDHTMDDKENDG